MIFPFDGIWPVIDETAFIAPGVVVVGRVEIGPHASIWYNSVVRGDVDTVKVGRYTNIQDGCILHQEENIPLVVGERVTVGHGVILHGCTVEDNAFIGMGATILNGARIGAGAVVGAGSLVLQGQEIPPGTLALGSPAKVVRTLSEGEIEVFRSSVDRYLKNAELHKKSLREAKQK
ncbi:MAG: gamma carbonic anhydrase family protein [Firmicutes bacterium]|nr:gamma carbonic anhydrase family protein [Bacillota bacterium]